MKMVMKNEEWFKLKIKELESRIQALEERIVDLEGNNRTTYDVMIDGDD